jgi:2-polyprenyl-3-methyl-5-hydroxy-6-metoxy-1,4-benzoquinol methylase
MKRRFSSALDVGCGEGLLKSMGLPGVVGIDIVPGPSVTILASGEYLPFRDESFQLVFAGEVIEHLSNPGGALKDWVRVLTGGGKMVISTPNGLRVKVTGGHPEHKRMFSPKDLGRALQRLGMTAVHSTGIFTGLVSGRRLFRRIPFGTLKTALLRFPVPASLSHNVFISAEKNPKHGQTSSGVKAKTGLTKFSLL